MKNFILILQFMTRIPININLEVKREDFGKSVVYFPLVGFIVGLFDLLVFYISSRLFPPMISSVFVVLSHIVITGGLHLDGLGDTVDGIYSGRDKERILEIMKDSRTGTFGVLALIIILLFRFAILVSLRGESLYRAVVIAPIIARTLMSLLMYKRPYAREKQGLGDLFIGQITRKTLIITLILGTIFTIIMGSYRGIIAMVVAVIFVLGFRSYVEKRIGGITGDILGASVEISEIIVLLCFIAK
jgi:adenosylcobinamide-GDP ribazoletransferase